MSARARRLCGGVCQIALLALGALVSTVAAPVLGVGAAIALAGDWLTRKGEAIAATDAARERRGR